jgi:sec-independent protein translocase protein TatA
MGFGTTELVIILAIIVLLFGAKKIPDLASGLGKGIKSFKKAVNEDEEVAKTDKVEEKPQSANTEKKPEETTKA